MEIRNDFNLPEAVYNTLAHDHYTPGDSDYSITGLMAPPQQTALMARHRDKVSIDATENMYSVFGTAVHSIIEKHTEEEALSEKRVYINVDAGGTRYTIGGQIDYYRAGVIRDYKVTTVNAYLMGSRFESWRKQLNSYAYLMVQNGYPVRHIEICMIFRDWSQFKARQVDYPQSPIIVKPFVKLPRNVAQQYITNALSAHVYASTLSDSELADKLPCSDRDMWRRSPMFALHRIGAKRALRVLDTKDKILKWADTKHYLKPYTDGRRKLQRSFYIEERPGECVRCANFCLVKDYCHQYQQELNETIEKEKLLADAKAQKKVQK